MNEEDQNPMLPNLRDECLSGMNSVVKGIFIGFAICVAAVIAWFIFSVTKPAKVQPKFEDMLILWTNGVEYFEITNVVFSSAREPVVTKTNGEWRIGFK